jgi:hypothetical protein
MYRVLHRYAIATGTTDRVLYKVPIAMGTTFRVLNGYPVAIATAWRTIYDLCLEKGKSENLFGGVFVNKMPFEGFRLGHKFHGKWRKKPDFRK